MQAARRLMVTNGFDATTMEAVADAADVSVGSLYNYFPTKHGLLFGVVAYECRALLDAGQAVVDADEPSTGPRDAIENMMRGWVDALRTCDAALLRRSLAVGFLEPFDQIAELVSLDRTMIEQLAAIVARHQSRGTLTRAVEAEQAAIVLYGTFCVAVMLWLSTPGFPIEDLATALEQQVKVVFRGLLPRRGRNAP